MVHGLTAVALTVLSTAEDLNRTEFRNYNIKIGVGNVL
jgi:hypothetical protein